MLAADTLFYCRPLEFIHLGITETLSPFVSSAPFLLPQPLKTTSPPLNSVSWTVFDISYEWNHAVFVLLWLAHATEHNVLQPQPGCTLQDWLLFKDWMVFHCVSQFFNALLCWLTWGCLCILGMVSNTIVNKEISPQDHVFQFFWIHTQKWGHWAILFLIYSGCWVLIV